MRDLMMTTASGFEKVVRFQRPELVRISKRVDLRRLVMVRCPPLLRSWEVK